MLFPNRKGYITVQGKLRYRETLRKRNPKKLNRKYFTILGLYRYVTYHDTVQESTPGCSCVRNLSMRSHDILYDINKTNAIKQIYLDNYFMIMFF